MWQGQENVQLGKALSSKQKNWVKVVISKKNLKMKTK